MRDSVSASTNDAVDQHIVDFSADDVNDALRQADGRSVNVNGSDVTLAGLAAAKQVTNDMTLLERVELVLSDPNIAFLLLSLGGLGLLIELVHPGVFFPGVFGSIALILAFFVLGTLPVNWAGVAVGPTGPPSSGPPPAGPRRPPGMLLGRPKKPRWTRYSVAPCVDRTTISASPTCGTTV